MHIKATKMYIKDQRVNQLHYLKEKDKELFKIKLVQSKGNVNYL